MSIPSNFEPPILRLDSVASTNQSAKDLAEQGATEGTCVVARAQTGGRGRGKRLWHSPAGGLYLSTLLYPKDSKKVTDLALVAGVALAQAVKESLPKSQDVTLKWPNDVLIGWKKAGGILCESLGETHRNFCVVGIGLNINVPQEELKAFENNPFGATSIMVEGGGGEFPLEGILNTLIRKLFAIYRLYHEQGFAPIQFLWERNCAFIGKKVELRESGWREGDPVTTKASQATVGTFLGIDESGALVLSNAKGDRHQYVSGEITCCWH